jgi:hypothetical protein
MYVTYGSNSERRVHYSRVRNLSEAIKMNEFQRQMSSTDLIEWKDEKPSPTLEHWSTVQC